ncbi:MAG: hypothetical protein ABH854_04345 [Candidatus Diapherotrites archaeon]|nr:hypothetical protein [Candidatus Micrarchaeota archaeon]MBU1939198.1 hypothetical protein [Candidatus Micrarchaeota archaeon]
MAEIEGVCFKEATKPATQTQVGHWDVVSGTATGRDVWLIREKKVEGLLALARYNEDDDCKRGRPCKIRTKEGWRHDLIYPELFHYVELCSAESANTQSKKLAEKIVHKIKSHSSGAQS